MHQGTFLSGNYVPPNVLVTFPLPDLEAGFSRSGVEDLDGLLEAFHFCAIKTMIQAQILRARNAPMRSLLGTID